MSDSPLIDNSVRQKGLHIIKPIVYGNFYSEMKSTVYD